MHPRADALHAAHLVEVVDERAVDLQDVHRDAHEGAHARGLRAVVVERDQHTERAEVLGLGAQVVVCEVEPLRALEAALDGFRVQPLVRAAAEADVLVTATGGKHVVSGPQLDALKDGAVLANAGPLSAELDLPALRAATLATQRVRPQLDELRLHDGRTVHLVADGRPVAPEGGDSRPAAVVDVALAAQALAAEYALHNATALERRVYAVPRAVDHEVAGVQLSTMGIEIDQLTEAQARYRATWDEGA